LGFTPWSDFSFFRSFIIKPFLEQDVRAIHVVRVILEAVLLRRQKDSRDRDGKKIVELPAKEVSQHSRSHIAITAL
jgi:DNA repair protein RAD5